MPKSSPSSQLRTWGRGLQEILLYLGSLGWLGWTFRMSNNWVRGQFWDNELLLVSRCNLYIYNFIYTRFLYCIYVLDCQETVRIMECACSVFRVLCENEDWFYSMVGVYVGINCICCVSVHHVSATKTWKAIVQPENQWYVSFQKLGCVCVCALFVQYILCSLSQYISTHTPCISCDWMFVSLIFTTMHRWLWFGIQHLRNLYGRNLPLLHPGVDFRATKMASQCWHLFFEAGILRGSRMRYRTFWENQTELTVVGMMSQYSWLK